MMQKLFKKLDGYRRWGLHELAMHRYHRMMRRKEAIFTRWLDQLRSCPPQVLVGPNFAEFGGVRHHIEAITRYSGMSLQLVPPHAVAKALTPYDVSSVFSDEFMQYNAKGVNVVHSHVFPWFIEWCQRRQADGIKWVHTYHLNYYPEHTHDGILNEQHGEINHALLEVAAKADVRLSVSKWQVDELRERHGIESMYIPNGVDLKLTERANAQRFLKRHSLDQFFLYVGRDDPVKNPREYVLLAQAMLDHQFVMVGGGLSSDSLRTNYRVTTPPNLLILGNLLQQEVQDALAACRVLIVTSKREGLPTLVMEAMALGRVIVVPDEAGCMESIGHGEAGLIYTLGDIKDLESKAIRAFHGNNDLGLSARERTIREYDWRLVSAQLDRVYRGE
jgi:glycosyltransferase involved in cell wall biosynthesis